MDASFPITLLRDLPVQSGSVDPHGVHVVAVVDGRYARRVPLDSVQDVFVSHDEHVPSSYDSPSHGDMAWDKTGLYVHTDAGWGKTMLYCSNWPDLTPTTRFLRVDAVMSLSGTEVDNALASLGIGDATDSLRGLVRLAGSMLDGAAVPTAATVAAYVAGELQGVKDDVAAVGVMRDEVAVMRQDVGTMESSVRSMRDAVTRAASEVHADMSKAKTAADEASTAAKAAKKARDEAEAAADRAEAAVEFDEVATQGSRKAVRSGGLYDEFASVKGSIQNVSDTLGAHTGDSVVHITQEERERWNAGGGGGGLTPEQQTVLDRLVGGAVAGEFSVWSATEPPSSATIHSYIGSSGTALDLAADSVSIVSGTGVSVDGGLDVDGSPVLTRAMLGAFPADGVEERDGVATVSDARAYIARSISESAGTVLANYVPLYGDSHITGSLSMSGDSRASTGTFHNGIVVTSATAVSSLAGCIDSDVKIGYGPTGNVKAETLLEVGDPKAAGTLSYNGFTLRIEAGSRSRAHGQLKLVNGYETCTVSIGGVTKSVSPVPLDSSVQAAYAAPAAAAVAASDAATASNGGESYASCLFGPVPDPSACSVSTIAVYWHGDGGPGTLNNRIAEFADADTLLDLPSVLASDPVLSALLSVSPVDPSAGCGTVVQRVSARVCGPLFEGFGISAAGPDNLNLIREVQLSGGSGGQGASRAIGVLARRVGSSVLLSNGTDSQSAVYIQSQDAVATLYKDGAVLSTVSIPYRSSFPAFVEKLQALVSDTGISVYKVTVVSRAAASSDTVTVQCIVDTPGSDGNGYFINVTAPDGLNLEIKFFAGADGDSPTPGPTPDPPAYGTAYGDIGPSVNVTGEYGRGVGIAWYGEGGPVVNPVYLIPALSRIGRVPTIDDFELLDPDHTEASPVFASRLRGSLVSGDLEPSYVARVQSVHKGSVDNGFAAVALDADTAKSLSTQLTGGLGAEQEAVQAIGVMCAYDTSAGSNPFSLYSYYVAESTLIVSRGDTISIEDSAGNVLASYSVDGPGLTLNELCDVINSMQGSIAGGPVLEAFVVPCFAKSGEVDEYTIHCRAVNTGAAYNGYLVRGRLNLAEDPLHISGSGVLNILMFAGADAYSPGPIPPGPTPEYDPVTPQQVATLVSTIPGYTGTVSSTDSNVVNVEAVQAGSDGNRDMAAYGGLIVQTPLGGGSDDRGVGELATAISSMDGFDVSASVRSPSVIRIVANASGSGPNGREFSATGCFGTEGAVMGSLVPGADGIPGTSYGLWINGVRVVPGQGGGGEPFDGHLENDLHIGHEGTAFKIYLNGEEFKGGGAEVEQEPVQGHTDNAVSSDGVYNVTHVAVESTEPVTDTLETSGTDLHDASRMHYYRYACIGSSVLGEVRGRLTAVRMQEWNQAGNFNDVQLLVSYDPDFNTGVHWSSNALPVGSSGSMHDWVFDDPIEITGEPLYLRWWGPKYQFNQTWLYCKMYYNNAGDDSYIVRGDGGAHDAEVPYCVLTVESGRPVVSDAWAGPVVEEHVGDGGIHVDREFKLEHERMASWLLHRDRDLSVPVSNNGNYKWLVLNRAYSESGLLNSVRIGRRHGSLTQNTVYLSVFQMPDGGDASDPSTWTFKGVSSNAVKDDRIGPADAEWLFDGVRVSSGLPLAFMFFASAEAAGTWSEAAAEQFGLAVGAKPDGDTETKIASDGYAPVHVGLSYTPDVGTGDVSGGGDNVFTGTNRFTGDVFFTGAGGTMAAASDGDLWVPDGNGLFYSLTQIAGYTADTQVYGLWYDTSETGVPEGGMLTRIPSVDGTYSSGVGVWARGGYEYVLVNQDADGASPKGVRIGSRSTPKWQDTAGGMVYDIVTTKSLDPARVAALEPPRENWPAFRLDNSYLVETFKTKGSKGGTGAFSVDGSGNLRSKYGGGVAGVMLPRAVKHFEGTMGTAGQNIAVIIATKLGDETGGVGVYIGNNNSNNMFICDASEGSIGITDTVQGYSKLPSVPSGKLTVDILDMYDSPQSGTGYTKRVVVKAGSAVVLDTYVDGGVGTKAGYVAPRIGFLGAWNQNGSWLLSDCKIAYKGVPPAAALESAAPADGGDAE